MAKQRRPVSSPPVKAPAPPAGSQAAASQAQSPGPGADASRTSSPPRRSTYVEAVGLYERGLEALQRHEFRTAEDLFESVLRLYPDEKELIERVRLYLNICQRQAGPREATPRTVDERLFASTLAINGGNYDEAISNLRLVRDEDPDNDHALYMLAVAHAQRGELTEALAHLQRAIALNPENRALARTDPDLDPLHEDDAFRAAVDAAPAPRIDRRRPIRTRSSR